MYYSICYLDVVTCRCWSRAVVSDNIVPVIVSCRLRVFLVTIIKPSYSADDQDSKADSVWPVFLLPRLFSFSCLSLVERDNCVIINYLTTLGLWLASAYLSAYICQSLYCFSLFHFSLYNICV